MGEQPATSQINAKRGALTAFSIRVVSAALAFFSQVFLARWLGAFEFGIYTYVWVWISFVGTLCAAGFATTVIRFVAEYTETDQPALVRGFLFTGRAFSLGLAMIGVCIGYLILIFGDQWVTDYYRLPAALALMCLPAYALTDFQDGAGKAKNWIDLSLIPPYILRPSLLLLFIGGILFMGGARSAETAVSAAILASWLTAIIQYVLQKRRMATILAPGPRDYRLKLWLKASLPVIAMESFGLLMMQLDVLLLDLYVTPDQIAIYFAAARTISLVNFVHFSIQAVALSRFATMHTNQDLDGARQFMRECRKWMFLASLVGAATLLFLGHFILSMFGDEFVTGYPVMVILSIGLLVRAFAGPLQGLLVITDQQNAAAIALGITVIVNVALNLVLIPRFGLSGAAAATSAAFTVESLLFFILSRRFFNRK